MRRLAKFGYTVENTRVQVIDMEAALIERIFEEYKGGLSTCKIAKKLNDQRLRYSEDSKEWLGKTVARILKDKTYIGNGDYPQVIDTETFSLVQNLLASKAHHIPEEEAPYAEVFKEKMRCTVCGSLIKRNTWQKGNNEKIIMRCSNTGCEGFKVRTRQIDIEAQIKSIFDRAYENEEIIEPPPQEDENMYKDGELTKMLNQIKFKMQDDYVEESEIIKGIQELASEKFSRCTATDNTEVTRQIKEKIVGCRGQERIKADVIGDVVQRILLAPDRTLVIKLKNGREFTERME